MSFEKTVNKLAGLDAFMRREAKLITGEVIGTYFGQCYYLGLIGLYYCLVLV